MSVAEKIEADYLAAYKAKDTVRVTVLRLLKTAGKNAQVERMRPLTDEDWLSLLQKEAKQRQDSIEQYSQAGRQDLVDKESAELTILRSYLPTPLSAEELEAAVDAAVEACGVSDMRGMGKVIQSVMGQYKGRVDGKVVSETVKRRLQGR